MPWDFTLHPKSLANIQTPCYPSHIYNKARDESWLRLIVAFPSWNRLGIIPLYVHNTRPHFVFLRATVTARTIIQSRRPYLWEAITPWVS